MADPEKVSAAQLETVTSNNDVFPKDTILAKQGAIDEHELTLAQALRKYPKAVMWSVLVSTAIIMEGYGECPPRIFIIVS
jgi:SP family general alpha glucoside:H+ symporter-like MFS transporter